MSKWTLFWDMHTGGSTKFKPYEKIYIEAEEEVAERVFYARTNRNPHYSSCACCGDDYSVSEHETLEKASYFHRGGRSAYGSYKEELPKITVEEYIAQPDVLVIYAHEIGDEERNYNKPPRGGYVWMED